jgi:hypothetical protein
MCFIRVLEKWVGDVDACVRGGIIEVILFRGSVLLYMQHGIELFMIIWYSLYY